MLVRSMRARAGASMIGFFAQIGVLRAVRVVSSASTSADLGLTFPEDYGAIAGFDLPLYCRCRVLVHKRSGPSRDLCPLVSALRTLRSAPRRRVRRLTCDVEVTRDRSTRSADQAAGTLAPRAAVLGTTQARGGRGISCPQARAGAGGVRGRGAAPQRDRKSTRLNSRH